MFVLGTWVRRSRQRIHRAAGYGVHAASHKCSVLAQSSRQELWGEQRRIPEHSVDVGYGAQQRLPGRRRADSCAWRLVTGDSGPNGLGLPQEKRLSAAPLLSLAEPC